MMSSSLQVDIQCLSLKVVGGEYSTDPSTSDAANKSDTFLNVCLLSDEQKERYGAMTDKDDLDPLVNKSIYCDACKKYFNGSCGEHPLLWVTGKRLDVCDDRAKLTLPSFLRVGPSSIPKANDGVFALTDIPVGFTFGPYEGRKLYNRRAADKTGYSWEICLPNDRFEFVDGSDTRQSNWLRYVNSARSESEQNVLAFQYSSCIWYRVIRPVNIGDELLVWYGDAYGRSLGVFRTKLTRSHPFIMS